MTLPLEIPCVVCGEPAGKPCRSPMGRLSPAPHSLRRREAHSRLAYAPSPEVEAAYQAELTAIGEQYVIPGCEKVAPSAKPFQMELFQ